LLLNLFFILQEKTQIHTGQKTLQALAAEMAQQGIFIKDRVPAMWTDMSFHK
jgi:hypothetical protein